MNPLGTGSTPGQNPLPAQTPGVWPPPPAGTPFRQSEEVNTSGMKGEVPPEIARLKWNWGAFSMNWLWCLNHKLRWGWGILALVVLVGIGGFLRGYFLMAYLGVAIYLGLIGQSLGWQNRHFVGGTGQYFAVQRKWMGWGMAVPLLLFTARVLFFVVLYYAGNKDL